jgi:aspartyl/asparaginyl beta-hydroxylase (cupin superfamily)
VDTVDADQPEAGMREKASVLKDQVIGTSNLTTFRLIMKFAGRQPFHDTADFPWSDEFEQQAGDIREELDAILQHKDEIPNFYEVSSAQYAITQDDHWKTFGLHTYGKRVEANCARCPKTTAALERFVPGLRSSMFSIIDAGKHIPAHSGPNSSVLRHHLGLKVPREAEKCKIRVGDQFRHWDEGKSLILDDTFDHEVWNDTDETRVVLFTDFLRPLKFPLSAVNRVNVELQSHNSFAKEILDHAARTT